MALVASNIKTFQKPRKLSAVKFKNLLGALEPDKIVALKTLVPKAESIAVPVKDLDHVAPPVAKYEKMPGKRIEVHLLGHDNRQAVDRFSHVGAAHGQVNTGVLRNKHHTPLNSPWIKSSC